MQVLQQVLDYWFGDEADDLKLATGKVSLWFGKDPDLDRQIGERFGTLVEQAAAGALTAQIDGAQARLAVIILLDQLTRNIYRGEPRSFASDRLALQLAREGLQAGEDRQLRPVERVFLYLPLEHSELLADQQESVARFEQLLAEVPAAWREGFAGYLDYAIQHRNIIERFGRFPHRNAILGRPSTADEMAFLAQPGSGF